MDNIRIVIVGHVDHGKSTLIGRLLHDTDSLPHDKIEALMRQNADIDSEIEYAYLLDQLHEERQQNMTIDTTQVFFKTQRRFYTIIDAPGHREFLNNMITGASQAEAALLIIDAGQGVREQTIRHAHILSLLGIDKIIVAINKMDLINYDQNIFETVAVHASRYLSSIDINSTHIIPISAKYGDNVASKSKNIGWYQGPSVVSAFDSVPNPKSLSEQPLRLPIQNIYAINGKQIIAGRIESGKMEKRQQVVLLPSGKKSRIKSIEVFDKNPSIARAGRSIGITLENALSIRRGEVICGIDSPPVPVDRFHCNIFWMSSEPFYPGQPLYAKCATQKKSCRIEKIEERINSSSLELIEENSDCLSYSEIAAVLINTECPIVVEEFSLIRGLGRIVLTDNHQICAAGTVVKQSCQHSLLKMNFV